MIFKESQPIYVQIAERLSDEILSEHFKVDERIPGVREYTALLEVNINTTMKAYDLLSTRGIIYTKRGLGYFVTNNAPQIIMKQRCKEFREIYLPDLFRRMNQLGLDPKDLEKVWEEFNKGKF